MRVARFAPTLVRQCKLAVRLLVGEHGLKANTGRYSGQGRQCDLCDGHHTETIEHFLFMCSSEAMHQVRIEQWPDIENSMPPAMRTDVSSMSLSTKAAFIMSGCYTWTLEWINIYKHILTFIQALYQTRDKLLESLDENRLN